LGDGQVKIFEKTWTSGLGTLEREINNFLATLPPGAVLNTQATMAAVRNDSDQTNHHNGKTVVVRIVDRGPYGRGRIIDVSRAAAVELDMISAGTVMVSIERR
jgi:Lytic transglycolase